MSAPRKVYNIQLVKIQSGERIAITPEQTFAPDKVTYLREAKGEGYRVTTQVKGLSSEIYHRVGGRYRSYGIRQNSHNQYWQGYANPTESKTVALYQKDITETWENRYIPKRIYRWSDKSIVARKFRNGNGAKGLTRRPTEGDTTARLRAGVQWSIKPKPVTYSVRGIEGFLKSRVREICKHGSVRGLIVSSRRWL